VSTHTSPAAPLTLSQPSAAPASWAMAEKLLETFPPRSVPDDWPETRASTAQILARLHEPPLLAPSESASFARRTGAKQVLQWLAQYPGETWQQRWNASPAPRCGSVELDARVMQAPHDPADTGWGTSRVPSGMLALICADVLRPAIGWLMNNYRSKHMVREVARARDPEGFAWLARAVGLDDWDSVRGAKVRVYLAMIIAAKGGGVRDITVGDCLEQKIAETTVRGYSTVAYLWLRSSSIFPSDAPATLRNIAVRTGQLTPAELIDRYNIACRPVRDILVDYLRERQAGLDYVSTRSSSYHLGKLFWADLEKHHPGIESLDLDPEVAAAWKDRLRTKVKRVKQADGTDREETEQRLTAHATFMSVRAFYLDLAQWALEEPERWGAWVARSPVSANEIRFKKQNAQRKARTDQRTRERMPVLPTLVRSVEQHLKDARARLQAVRSAPPAASFTVRGEKFTKARSSNLGDAAHTTTAYDAQGRRTDLRAAESKAFWTWASVEFLRHTGCRIEEMLETSHHGIVRYTLPSTGEIVPLLQIAPSKTDQERLLLVTPELADVLSAIVTRVRNTDGAVPLVAFYDPMERIWNPPMPLLFQHEHSGQPQGITFGTIRKYLKDAVKAAGIVDAQGEPLLFQPHDFRRIFVTDAILNGLPPHIAQVIVGHKNINTTMGYHAVYPAAVIEAHRAFIARRRATRPSEEYRTPTSEEWDEFLGGFERRKLAIGTCGRAYGTDCAHEHACIRCSLLRADARDRPRMVEIRDNLTDRIAEAEREGWLGEVENLTVSLEAAKDKIAQLDAAEARRTTIIQLGMPGFAQVAGRDVSTARTAPGTQG
jgi:Phage integrase family